MKEEKNNIIAIRLKELRENLNLSQEEFSKKVNLSNQTICNYENGRKIPTIDIVFNIAETFNVSIDWLCGRTEEKDVSFKGIESLQFKTYSDVIKCLLKLPDLSIKEDIAWGEYDYINPNYLNVGCEPHREKVQNTRKVYTLLLTNEEIQKELYQLKYISDLDSNVVKEKDKQKLINSYIEDDFNKMISKNDSDLFFKVGKDSSWKVASYDNFRQDYDIQTETNEPLYNLKRDIQDEQIDDSYVSDSDKKEILEITADDLPF